MTTIRLAESNFPFLGSRQLASRIRERVEEALLRGDSVGLDFAGIDEISDSFADELIGRLIAEATEPILSRLQFINCNRSVDLTIQVLLAEVVRGA